jgi:hypothetical protein
MAETSLLSRIMQEQKAFQDQLSRTITQVQAASEKGRTEAVNTEQLMKARDAAAIAQKALTNAGAVAEAENARTIASAFGVNIADSNNLIVPTAEIARRNAAEANDFANKADAERNVNFFQDPIRSLASVFTVPYYEDAARVRATTSLNATARLNALNVGAQTTIKTEEMLKRGVTAEVAQKDLEVAAANAEIALQAFRETNRRQGMQDLVTLQQLNGQQLTALVQLNSVQNEAERLRLSREANALSRRQVELAMAEKLQTAQEQEAFTRTVNTGRAAMGLAPMARAEIKNYMSLGGEGKSLIETWYKTGVMRDSAGIVTFAPDPASAVTILNSAGAVFPEGHPKKPIIDFVNSAQIQFRQTVQGRTATKPQEILAGTNTAALESTKQQAALIKPGDATNIYAALPFSVITDVAAVKETKLFAALLGPQKEAGIVDVTPQQLLSQTAQLVASGRLDLQTAASDFSMYMKAAIEANNAVRDYNAFGLPRQRTYRTNVELTPGQAPVVIDLANDLEVSSILFRFQMEDRMKKFGPTLSGAR